MWIWFVSASEVHYWCLNAINCTGKKASKDLLLALGEADANMYLCSKDIRPSMKTFISRRNHSSASDFTYSYPLLCSVVCRLSAVCHTRAPCLNRSTDLHAIWLVHLGDQWHIVLDGGPWSPKEEEIWGLNPLARNCTCLLMIHQVAAPISDFVSYEITFDLF